MQPLMGEVLTLVNKFALPVHVLWLSYTLGDAGDVKLPFRKDTPVVCVLVTFDFDESCRHTCETNQIAPSRKQAYRISPNLDIARMLHFPAPDTGRDIDASVVKYPRKDTKFSPSSHLLHVHVLGVRPAPVITASAQFSISQAAVVPTLFFDSMKCRKCLYE